MIIEQAGGIASTGMFQGKIQRVLDLVPTQIHDKCPIIMGGKRNVQLMYDNYKKAGEADVPDLKNLSPSCNLVYSIQRLPMDDRIRSISTANPETLPSPSSDPGYPLVLRILQSSTTRRTYGPNIHPSLERRRPHRVKVMPSETGRSLLPSSSPQVRQRQHIRGSFQSYWAFDRSRC